MGVKGAGSISLASNKAGPAFVEVTKAVQLSNKLKVDGIYGEATHERVAPHFTAYCVWLYKTAALRKPIPPDPVPNLAAKEAAIKLLQYHKDGKYHDDSGSCLAQIQATANGKPVWSPGGYWVYLDRRILDGVLWLLEHGSEVGTFAICSDHAFDSRLGHAGGHAIDISSFSGVSVAAANSRAQTLKVAILLHNAPGALHPWQLICGGYGNHRDAEISALSIPAADSFYGPATMQQHTNHVHLGYE